jgi:hypothetical protein
VNRPRPSGSSLRLLFPALAVLGLIAVVAVASTGSTSSSSGDTRRPGDALLDTVFSLGLVASLALVALVVYVLMQRRPLPDEMVLKHNRLRHMLPFLLVCMAFAFVVLDRRDLTLPWENEPPELTDVTPPAGIQPDERAGEDTYQFDFAWLPVLVVLALVAAAVAAWYLAERSARPARHMRQLAEDVAAALDDTLDDLRAEPDPRRAVIAAFARLERALGSVGLPRARAETAQEYVARVLERLDVDVRLVRRLTDLFTTAKFSQHEVGPEMKEEAIAALERIRDDVRVIAELRREAAMRGTTYEARA